MSSLRMTHAIGKEKALAGGIDWLVRFRDKVRYNRLIFPHWNYIFRLQAKEPPKIWQSNKPQQRPGKLTLRQQSEAEAQFLFPGVTS